MNDITALILIVLLCTIWIVVKLERIAWEVHYIRGWVVNTKILASQIMNEVEK